MSKWFRSLPSSKLDLSKTMLSLGPNQIEGVRTYLSKLKDEGSQRIWNRFNNHPDRKSLLSVEVKKLIQNRVMNRKLREVPTEKDIQEFTLMLETSSTVEVNDEGQRAITYANFEKLLRKAPARIKAIVPTATLFARSSSDLDGYGRLGTDLIINFVALKSTLCRQRIGLTRYDLDCTGYLNQDQLVDYLRGEVIPHVELGRSLESSQLHSYLMTTVLMFSFFLDAKRTGRYRIADILTSGFIENIFALQDLLDSFDENGRTLTIGESWFSPGKTQTVLSSFRRYDKADRGYLTRDDFIEIEDGGFTYAFVDRLFQVHVKRGGKMMSLSEYTTFEIAHDHMQHPSSVNYFFKVLDLSDKGHLTRSDLFYFYENLRDSYDAYFMGGEVMPSFDDYFDQMFDMAQPSAADRITLKDLLDCKQGHNFIRCLINFFEFHRFETREEGMELDSMMLEDGGEAEELQEPQWPTDYQWQTSKSPESMMNEAN